MQPIEKPYWHHYYDSATIARAEGLMQEHTLRSGDDDLYVNVYQRPERDAPVFVGNHGGGGYSGIFIPLALAFYERGYTVVIADMQGHGRTGVGPTKGDFTIDGMARNIVDVVAWARQRYSGPVFMGSGSIGSGITYNAVAMGAAVHAVATAQLYAFDDPRTALLVSKFAPLANMAGLAWGIKRITRPLARRFPRLRLPYLPMAHWDAMFDERDQGRGFVPIWKRDPYTPRSITLRALASMQYSPPRIPLAQNQTPWLVINTMRDKMVPPHVTEETYQRLGGPRQYVEMDWGHFSHQPAFTEQFVSLTDAWFKLHGPSRERAGNT
ncbi:MAG: alpha/beta hydrolase [Chloroflexaceae bacterium]|nr:alpha/beta hydrolase [Chloroflexaceae bacterium]